MRVGSLVEGSDERAALRFSAPLTPFAIEVIATFDRDDPAYLLDVVSVIEAVLDDPRQILYAQQNAAKGVAVARLKSEGMPYEERMEQLDTITWPKPLAELLDDCFHAYHQHHPWIHELPAPKSILREMLEGGDTFAVDFDEGRGTFSVPGLVNSSAGPIANPLTGQIHRATVRLAQSFEFVEAEFVDSKVHGEAPIVLDWERGHGHLTVLHMNAHGLLR